MLSTKRTFVVTFSITSINGDPVEVPVQVMTNTEFRAKVLVDMEFGNLTGFHIIRAEEGMGVLVDDDENEIVEDTATVDKEVHRISNFGGNHVISILYFEGYRRVASAEWNPDSQVYEIIVSNPNGVKELKTDSSIEAMYLIETELREQGKRIKQ